MDDEYRRPRRWRCADATSHSASDSVTQPARITQADMERALKAVKAAGFEQARVIMHLATAEIEIILGATTGVAEPNPWKEEWTDDDY